MYMQVLPPFKNDRTSMPIQSKQFTQKVPSESSKHSAGCRVATLQMASALWKVSV